MWSKIHAICVLFLIYGTGNAQGNLPNDYYVLINSVRYRPDTLIQFNLCSTPETYHFFRDTNYIFQDSIFSKEDIQSFREQLQKWENVTWQDNKIHGAKLISQKRIHHFFKRRLNKKYDGWKHFNKRYGRSFKRYGLPLFTADKTKCLLYAGTHCGWLCGSGTTSLYELKDGKWNFIKSYRFWIS